MQTTLWDEHAEYEQEQFRQARQHWELLGWQPQVGGMCHLSALTAPVTDCDSIPDVCRSHITVGQCFYICGDRARILSLTPAEAFVQIESHNANYYKNGLKVRLKLYDINPSFVRGKFE